MEYSELRHYQRNAEIYPLGDEAEDMWGLVDGELAHLTRNALAPILKEFERLGFVRCGYRVVEVLDAAGLGDYVSMREGQSR